MFDRSKVNGNRFIDKGQTDRQTNEEIERGGIENYSLPSQTVIVPNSRCMEK